jgi:hypothetical protein
MTARPCDYLLFVERRACGIVEAKPEGKTLFGVADSAKCETATANLCSDVASSERWSPSIMQSNVHFRQALLPLGGSH